MIARVFPRKTRATPIDEYAFVGELPLFIPDDLTEVHISVTWTDDIPEAERLQRSWERTGLPVTLGGPATGAPGEDFTPGKYLKPGYVITSRGCPNRCWFCSVWKREGQTVRELPITQGNNILDDNLLACSDDHINAVFRMLKEQTLGRPIFSGGLEAARLKQWHCEEIAKLKPEQVFFAYDTPDDKEPLFEAGIMLRKAGLKIKHPLRAYVLIGYPKDTLQEAEARLWETVRAGFLPMAMLYGTKRPKAWRTLQRLWARPIVTSGIIKKGGIHHDRL